MGETALSGVEGVRTGGNCSPSKCVKKPDFKTNTGVL